ncbi:hypothetical protein GF382_00535 [Candidatus Falkowbacteria bacterium]|nr:hypothetical protein [Candidatus Falkowbacteria bacterium]
MKESFNMMPSPEKKEKKSPMEKLRGGLKGLMLIGALASAGKAGEKADLSAGLDKYLEDPEEMKIEFVEEGEQVSLKFKEANLENLANGMGATLNIEKELKDQGLSEEQIAEIMDAPAQEDNQILDEEQVASMQ